MKDYVIEVDQVVKKFSTPSGEVHAFGPTSLMIEKGSFISLLGASGCGKSTLLWMIGGLLKPSEGTIHLNGNLVTSSQKDIAIMFQDSTLVPWRTIKKNIDLQLEMRNISPKEKEEEVYALLRSVHLEKFANNYPSELSGGMCQRAALCQSIIHNPSTLLLDEPLGKLDAITRQSIQFDLQNLWLKNKSHTVVLVTHSIEEAVFLSSQVCVVSPRPGKVVEVLDIDIDFPRTKEVKRKQKFQSYVSTIENLFEKYGIH